MDRRELFVGNKLAAGDAEWSEGRAFDLRSIRSPIVVFASLGDNITPPQQAINWVLDLYPTTEHLKANGQVIVGLMHRSVGHLGIFVSGSVATKEHAQIVELLTKSDAAAGLYGMQIDEKKDARGRVRYDVSLVEHRIEDLRKLQKYDRKDEIPFEAVAQVSEAGEAFFEAVIRPMLQPLVSPAAAEMTRAMHPLRMQRWALSSLNPAMAFAKSAAEFARAARAPRDEAGAPALAETLRRVARQQRARILRAVRDAVGEYLFFSVYGAMSVAAAGRQPKTVALRRRRRPARPSSARPSPRRAAETSTTRPCAWPCSPSRRGRAVAASPRRRPRSTSSRAT